MELSELKAKAKEVAQKAHAPYSNFRVGSAILTKSGQVYTGCNVENMSYGLTICAERNAIFSAIAAEGKTQIEQVVVYTETQRPATPCGACRQIIYEFCEEDVKVHSFCDSEKTHDTSIMGLLPDAFNLNDY
ncbi:MAG: cytidine deaminase [Cyclobacteriaceae bacterium]